MTAAGLQALYDDTVLDHSRRPRNRRAIEGGRNAEQRNPICGDRITVHVLLEGDVIRDVSFEGSACAISIASASLMTEVVTGQTIAHTDALAEQFRRMIAAPPSDPIEDMGTLAALAGVRQFPIRVKCARLAWQALAAAINGSERGRVE
jgi:nitrogen fixation protein NifU and related proteins